MQDFSLKNKHLRTVDNSLFAEKNDTFILTGEMKNYMTNRSIVDNQVSIDSFVYRYNMSSTSKCLKYNLGYLNKFIYEYFENFKVLTGESVVIITGFGRPEYSEYVYIGAGAN